MDSQYAILLSDDRWRIGRHGDDGHVTLEPVAIDGVNADTGRGADVASLAAAAREQLQAAGWADQPVVLIVPSAWCLSATIATDDLERGNRRRAMNFALEEHLPMSAEDFIADYCEAGAEALGVACELDRLRPIVEALEQAGVSPLHVSPAALMAAAEAHEADGSLDAVLIVGPGKTTEADSARAGDAPERDGAEAGQAIAAESFDLVELHRGQPARWWWLADDVEALADALSALPAPTEGTARVGVIGGEGAMARVAADERLEAVAVAGAGAGALADDRAGAVNDRDRTAVMHASRLLGETATPWIDLRREALGRPDRMRAYRRPAMLLAAAVVLMLISVIAVGQWRGRQYAARADQYRQQQVAAFAEAFPNTPPPPRISDRLRSEARAISANPDAGGDAVDATGTPQGSALVHLHAFLEALPVDQVRFRIMSLTIRPDWLEVNGQARTASQAEQIARSFSNTGRYDLTPISTNATQVMGQPAVTFSFSARPRDTAQAVAAGGGRP
mgnify:CR=1 FL=1